GHLRAGGAGRTAASLAVRSALRAAAEEAVDGAAAAGADVAAADRRELLQDGTRRHQHPLAVDQRAPLAFVGEIGAGRPAIAFDAVNRAVAAGVAGAGLLEFLVPVVILGMTLAMPALSFARGAALLGNDGPGDHSERDDRNNRPTAKGHRALPCPCPSGRSRIRSG